MDLIALIAKKVAIKKKNFFVNGALKNLFKI